MAATLWHRVDAAMRQLEGAEWLHERLADVDVAEPAACCLAETGDPIVEIAGVAFVGGAESAIVETDHGRRRVRIISAGGGVLSERAIVHPEMN